MAIPRAQSAFDMAAAGAESCPFVMTIKNTFIDVAHTDDSLPRTSRRSASAPPLTREKADDCSSLQSLPFKAGSSVSLSTASGDDTEYETASDTDTFSAASSSEGTKLSLAELLPEKTSLRSLARPWAPPEKTRPGLPPEVQSAFSEVIMAGQNALCCCPCVLQVGNTQHAGGWSLIASIPRAQFQQLQPSLATMQKALLGAAEASEKAYIIGYDTTPFTPLPHGNFGFRAQLAIVQDESSACWDLLSTGYCRRGCACRWQHPSWQASLDVTIQLV